MKLRKIEISKFRSIDSVIIDIADMVTFIGENNAGKSNILRALGLFYQESMRSIDEECFFYKDRKIPIEIILTFDRLCHFDRTQKYLKHWIYQDAIRVKKVVDYDEGNDKYKMTFYGWQARPKEKHFDLSRFDEYKADIRNIVSEQNLPDYFKTENGSATQASYKQGVQKHIKEGKVEMGNPGWIKNPAGLKEVLADLLPKYYLLPAVTDAQDESKTTQQAMMGKLIADLTNRIVQKNPKFEKVKAQLNELKKFLNKADDGSEKDRLEEIKDFEGTISSILSESMPGSRVNIEIVTPELVDLFKDVKVTLDDTLPTSIDSKGHGLQRALIFAYIRAYAKAININADGEKESFRSFILAIEEPELYLHPNGQRKMKEVLENIIKTDQVLVCTHSSFFVDMFSYRNMVLVNRDGSNPTNICQFTGDIFEGEDGESKRRLEKVFRYLSFFDLSRSEMFFSRKVILVEGNTEKFIIPFWAIKHAEKDKRYDFPSNNICVVDCGGKTNIHIFMRVLNNFKIPYIVIHDIDPLRFPEDKEGKTDKEESQLRMFKENEFIEHSLDDTYGRIIQINPVLENIIGILRSQADKHGKIGAAYNEYEDKPLDNYPEGVQTILNLIAEWDRRDRVVKITAS